MKYDYEQSSAGRIFYYKLPVTHKAPAVYGSSSVGRVPQPHCECQVVFSFVTIVFLLLFTTAHYGSGASALRAYVVPSALQSRYVMGGSCFAGLSQLPASLRAGTRVRAVVRCPWIVTLFITVARRKRICYNQLVLKSNREKYHV